MVVIIQADVMNVKEIGIVDKAKNVIIIDVDKKDVHHITIVIIIEDIYVIEEYVKRKNVLDLGIVII